jgi:hypothetical protein
MREPERIGGPDLEASGAMMRIVSSAWAARMVHTAAELGIADHLERFQADCRYPQCRR